ncbi:PREDICTED: thymic stromal lymphopoietin isoform X2 [Hipposideros armiger]|uniref:Thymic stromal lymphopoietin isoform X2 n=1 Tax=Hipposideros armiger TaxID=186990 RepID=A0A8B7QLD0_HIPAR|nr:PREDICTED: thymic stromal lymphopoietin isoform X2 [Hipposideros armiger]
MFHYLVNDKSGSIGNKCLGGNVFQSIFKTWAPTATCTDCLYCKDEPDCLAKIERLTLYPNDGCKSLADELFAVKTNETLTLRCPGYSGIQSLRDGSWGLAWSLPSGDVAFQHAHQPRSSDDSNPERMLRYKDCDQKLEEYGPQTHGSWPQT